MLAEGVTTGSGGGSVTLVTEVVLAGSAALGVMTPFLFRWSKAHKDRLARELREAASVSGTALAGWTALNGALQAEIVRLQALVDRLRTQIEVLENRNLELTGRYRTRVTELEAQIMELHSLALKLGQRGPGA